ncbi:MAG TPA: T9SS type A sorting domain-containing protein, partial [Bacteroidia bacterium]|nr:T9SS type A sorting domain-containing protein [Bacteroidia bacterium]
GYNLKHADCNGDGIINSDDTLAINLNYGLTHTLRPSEQNHINTTGDIYFGSVQTTYGANQNVAIDVYLGESTNPLTNFYGAAFTIDYNDNTLIQPGSMSFSIDNSTWVGTINTDAIRLTKTMEASESIDAAISKTDHVNTSGFGKIGTLRFTTATTNGDFSVTANNAYYIDNAGLQTPLTAATYSVTIDPTVSIQNHVSSSNISIYPNPNNGSFTINNLNPKEEYQLEVKDVLGRTIYIETIKAKETKANIKLDQAPGVYWLQLNSKQGSSMHRVVID